MVDREPPAGQSNMIRELWYMIPDAGLPVLQSLLTLAFGDGPANLLKPETPQEEQDESRSTS